MNLVKISASYSKSGGLAIAVTTCPPYKETKSSYVWDGHRIAKNRLNKIDSTTYNNTLTHAYFYILSQADEASMAANTELLKTHLVSHMNKLITDSEKAITEAKAVLRSPAWASKVYAVDC